jgi:ATP phosphoribosyltransferase
MKLTIAIQRSGRLAEESLRLLKESGIGISNGLSKLKSEATNFPAEIYYLRDDDIPQYVEDGIADVGIVGENVFLEKKKEAALVSRLGFGKCRLSIAVAKDKLINGVHDLENMRIPESKQPHSRDPSDQWFGRDRSKHRSCGCNL